MPRPSHRPRPARPTPHEPSLTRPMLAAVALMTARRVITPEMRKRLELTGLAWDEVAPVLTGVRTINQWAAAFGRAADAREAVGDHRRAAAFAFLGQLVLSPSHPRKAPLQEQSRRCQTRDRSARKGVRFERLILCGGAIAAYRETPERSEGRPTIVLLPPLASTKEELTLLADPLLAAGFPVLRADLPGQGESPSPLTKDAERSLMRALDEAGVTAAGGVIAGGISLGAYFALRLAGADPGRVRGAFGVSPPAIVTPEQWSRQPEVIWQYLDLYFAAETRADSLRLGMAMDLDDVVSAIRCPVRLYHAAGDRISLPDARDRYRAALSAAALTDIVLPGNHGCLPFLRERIAPEVAEWAERVTP